MKEFRLINMTDFVISQWDKDITREEFAQSMINYATFLKQPLKLEMFVQCDEEGEILNYNEILESVKEGTETWAIWETAKEKVLFKEFESIGGIAMAKAICETFHTIEDLASKKIPLVDLQLTPTAIKQIQP